MSDTSKIWWCENTRISAYGIEGIMPGSAAWNRCFDAEGSLDGHDSCGFKTLVDAYEDTAYEYEARVEWYDDRKADPEWKVMGLPGLKESYFGETPHDALANLVAALHETGGGSALKAIHWHLSKGGKIRIVRRRVSDWFGMPGWTESVLKSAAESEPLLEPAIELLP